MRILKFRQPVFNKNGTFSHCHYWGWISEGNFVAPLSMAHECKREKGQQYTVRNDKKGIEAYEGDILRLHDIYGPHIGIIEWWEDRWTVAYKEKNHSSKQHLSLMTVNDFEVIGNVHQNPELV